MTFKENESSGLTSLLIGVFERGRIWKREKREGEKREREREKEKREKRREERKRVREKRKEKKKEKEKTFATERL